MAASAGLTSGEALRLLKLQAFFSQIPSRDAALAAAVLYAATSVAVLATTIKTRAWFMLIVAITGLCEVLGFAFRVVMIADPKLAWLVAMQLFLIVPPVLLAIVEYVAVGRLLCMSAAGRASKLGGWTARLFTASDVICLLVQGAGGSLAGTSQEKAEVGRALILAGLILQLGFFTLFTGVAIHVQRTPRFGFRGCMALRPMFGCMYATIALMYVRNIFRVIEFGQGYKGYLATHEVFFYVFDFVPIFSCFLLFTWLNYGFYFGAAEAAAAAADARAGSSGAPKLVGDVEAAAGGNGALPMVVVEALGG
ncbi:hypothetical protein MNEG_10650 [Monoraphidium neglectum]|jgi:hypothetical protein|uniref:Uncharacterized protein n=1 Tax=Monoraphidium neglectum TaxID=145388 RepID=A0A0D2M870_9CHLO|nr:hypothetical protein MNEG_10650 [Monoraphidium neglectum]KIY97311.1 hypothetical protein MNEG_10650 [Monoraphidium neglectum]|eukprot:XP_013896331.1 hypothetical protein MNEG_10650 [Monoraphidium neglectum]